MKFKRLPILLFVVFLLSSFSNSFLQAAPKIHYTIVYTNDVMGEVEPCG